MNNIGQRMSAGIAPTNRAAADRTVSSAGVEKRLGELGLHLPPFLMDQPVWNFLGKYAFSLGNLNLTNNFYVPSDRRELLPKLIANEGTFIQHGRSSEGYALQIAHNRGGDIIIAEAQVYTSWHFDPKSPQNEKIFAKTQALLNNLDRIEEFREKLAIPEGRKMIIRANIGTDRRSFLDYVVYDGKSAPDIYSSKMVPDFDFLFQEYQK